MDPETSDTEGELVDDALDDVVGGYTIASAPKNNNL